VLPGTGTGLAGRVEEADWPGRSGYEVAFAHGCPKATMLDNGHCIDSLQDSAKYYQTVVSSDLTAVHSPRDCLTLAGTLCGSSTPQPVPRQSLNDTEGGSQPQLMTTPFPQEEESLIIMPSIAVLVGVHLTDARPVGRLDYRALALLGLRGGT
jgi:hypothetical protein